MEMEFLLPLSQQPAYGFYHTPVDLSPLSQMESVWGGIRFCNILSFWPLIPDDNFLSHFVIKTVYALLINLFNHLKHSTENLSKYLKNWDVSNISQI